MLYQCPDGNCPFLVDIAPVHARGDLNPHLCISLALFRAGLFKTGLTLQALRVISIHFLLVMSMLCKTEWSWELQTLSHKMNFLDILSTSPHYFCREWRGATNENSNFDRWVLRVNPWLVWNLNSDMKA